MILNDNLKKVLIIDFGSQFTQLIARRVRESGIYSEIISHKKALNIKKFQSNIGGIILSGGNDVEKKTLRYKFQVYLVNFALKNKIPILGICQGMQMMGIKFGSKLVKVKNHIRKNHKLINLSKEKFPKKTNSYHQYSLKSCPKNFFITTKSLDGNIESIKHKVLPWEGWMWHPERDKKTDKINNLRLKKIFG